MFRNFLNAAWDRWANLHPFVRFLIGAGVVALGGFLFLKPAYRAFKAYRLEKNLVAAEQAVKEVRMDEARDLSLTVLRAGDPRIEAFRILEKSTASLRDPMHGDIARALMSHPEGSDEDRLNGFRGMAPDAPIGVLGQAWAGLPEKSKKDPAFAAIFAGRLLSAKRFSEAASVLLAVPETARTAEVNQALVRVLIGSGKKEGFDEAQRWIAGKWPAAGGEVSGWLEVFEEIPVAGLRADLLEPLRKAWSQPGQADAARSALAIERINYAADFNGRAAVLDRAVSRWKDDAPEALAKFLRDIGTYRLLMETFPIERVAGHPGLLPYLLEAMRNSDAWDQVKLLLDACGDQLPRVELLARRAVVAAKTGDSPAEARLWNEAMGEAKSGTTPNAHLLIYQIARDSGLEAEAEQAMLEAIRQGRGPLPLYADLKFLLNSLATQGRENELLQICATYLPFEPGNPVLLPQYAYLACLNDLAEPKLILKAVKPLAEAFPDALPIQCVLATLYLSDGNATAAAETLDRLKVEPDKLAPGYRAAFLTTQVLAKRLSKDDPKITDFPWKSLLPSERRKFGQWIRNAQP
jgi:hypothetical protein